MKQPLSRCEGLNARMRVLDRLHRWTRSYSLGHDWFLIRQLCGFLFAHLLPQLVVLLLQQLDLIPQSGQFGLSSPSRFACALPVLEEPNILLGGILLPVILPREDLPQGVHLLICDCLDVDLHPVDLHDGLALAVLAPALALATST